MKPLYPPRRKPRAHRPPSKPLPTSTLVVPLFRWLKLDEAAKSFLAMRAFSVACGARIRQRARGERLRGGTLFVRVESAAWSHELGMMKAQLVDKIRRTPGGEEVEDLRFSVGPLDDLPDWMEPAARPPRPVQLAEVEGRPTPSMELLRALDDVKDPTLREISRLYARFGAPRPTRP